MDQATSNSKRKAAGEVAAAYHEIVSPRLTSCKMMRKSIASRPVTPWSELGPGDEVPHALLPRELFCNIITYLGPTSSSLCTLGGVNRYHRSIMATIGGVMLRQARLRFRTPLPPKSQEESSISLSVRHARTSKAVHDKLEVLHQVLMKDIPVIEILGEAATNDPIGPLSDRNLDARRISGNDPRVVVDPSEVQHALNVALCLLGCWKRRYFDDANAAREIAENAATTALEWRVTELCGVLGARAYKYAKSRMCRRREREYELFATARAVTDEMPLEKDEDFDDDYDNVTVDSTEFDDDEDMAMLEKANLVMQHVVLREKQNTNLNDQTTAAMAPKQVQ